MQRADSLEKTMMLGPWAPLIAQLVKNPTPVVFLECGRPPGEGKGYSLQYSSLENSIVHGVTKSRTHLSDFHCVSDAGKD